ncbi:hypothetical protein HBI56_172900 [Parastagonospora nodorum]|uniref:Small secreted protein n=1 Tax=Phaeosphaeria nodorum (strain SN15 / ATCC MYA-4574 / FGSC 10173) TaxID=321614 RepID=A0A7U2HZ27_PHANO|nr:hypothetical protein HBH56_221740 [Parastagonospora nodorum]QRC97185.1 hypothetical protein JI435_139390 [Parastagonospora nodorum SN15]KAH3924136.1 hypothetical protein HBH54_200010 [Parastagonospora nodorum]KAH3944647.1 hypothetical protein HBH53_156380 [Parastagonospora nodorum]KAH3963488.1 hypothetical protein HBH51_168320 [Parastagonospora nodorum]
MHFQSLTILSLAAFAVALPASLQTRQAGVLQATTFNDISIAGGQAGNAEEEAAAAFSALDLTDPASVSKADQDFLNEVNQVANDAEKEAFNPAVEAATGTAAEAAQNGKIKNKVLKLMATVIKLEAQQAQGEDVAAKLAEETKKLDNNIATDKANAGQASTAVPFDAAIAA